MLDAMENLKLTGVGFTVEFAFYIVVVVVGMVTVLSFGTCMHNDSDGTRAIKTPCL